MKGRILSSVAMSAIGVSMLVAAMLAGSASGGTQAASKKSAGGSITITNRSDFDYVDPGLSYFSHTWNMMSASQLTLLYYPHVEGAAGGRLAPMAAQGMPKVSNGGKTYTFTIKKGFKFSDGTAVTSANFKRAFDRGVNKAMQSPASSFLDDVASWKAPNASTFVVAQKKVAPDFMARMSMMFFAAVPANLPFTAEGVKAPTVSAGPYYLKEWNEKTSALMVRNPYWKNNVEPFKSLGFKNNLDQVRWIVGADPATQRLQCEKGEADICGFPPAQAKELSDKYGLNKSQFFVKPQSTLWYIAMNTTRPIFTGNTALRQAVSNALDRKFMTAQHGYLAGKRTDQFLPYSMPGFKDANIYSLQGPNYPKAKALAAGKTRDGKAVMYTSNVGVGPPDRAVDPVQPEADRHRRRDQAARPCRPAREGRHQGRALRPDVRGLGHGLPGSRELHQRAARRPPDPARQQRQRLVLQRREVQRTDGQGIRSGRSAPAGRVRRARQGPDEGCGSGRSVHLDQRPHPDEHQGRVASATRRSRARCCTQICTK